MRTITIRDANANLYKLVDEAITLHEPIQIIGPESNVVLISEAEWRSIQETLYLISIPGMRESIQAGLQTSLDDCAEDLEW